jgi:hypothetical protein
MPNDQKYLFDGQEYTISEVEAAAAMSNLSLDEYLSKHEIKPIGDAKTQATVMGATVGPSEKAPSTELSSAKSNSASGWGPSGPVSVFTDIPTFKPAKDQGPKISPEAEKARAEIDSVVNSDLTEEEYAAIDKQVNTPVVKNPVMTQSMMIGPTGPAGIPKVEYTEAYSHLVPTVKSELKAAGITRSDAEIAVIAKERYRQELVRNAYQAKIDKTLNNLENDSDNWASDWSGFKDMMSSFVTTLAEWGSNAASIGTMGTLQTDPNAFKSRTEIKYDKVRKEVLDPLQKQADQKLVEYKRNVAGAGLSGAVMESKLEELKSLKDVIETAETPEQRNVAVEAFNNGLTEYNAAYDSYKDYANKVVENKAWISRSNIALDAIPRSYDEFDVFERRMAGGIANMVSGVSTFAETLALYAAHYNTPAGAAMHPDVVRTLYNTPAERIHDAAQFITTELDKDVRRRRSFDNITSASDMLEFTVDLMGDQTVQLGLIYLTGGTGSTMLMGASSAGNKFEELYDRKLNGEKMSDAQFLGTGILYGVAEAGSEYITATRVLRNAEVARAMIKGGAKTYDEVLDAMQKGLRRNLASRGYEAFEEGGTEAINQIAQNMLDKYVMQEENVDIFRGVDQAFVSGALMSALMFQAPSMIAGKLKGLNSTEEAEILNANAEYIKQRSKDLTDLYKEMLRARSLEEGLQQEVLREANSTESPTKRAVKHAMEDKEKELFILDQYRRAQKGDKTAQQFIEDHDISGYIWGLDKRPTTEIPKSKKKNDWEQKTYYVGLDSNLGYGENSLGKRKYVPYNEDQPRIGFFEINPGNKAFGFDVEGMVTDEPALLEADIIGEGQHVYRGILNETFNETFAKSKLVRDKDGKLHVSSNGHWSSEGMNNSIRLIDLSEVQQKIDGEWKTIWRNPWNSILTLENYIDLKYPDPSVISIDGSYISEEALQEINSDLGISPFDERYIDIVESAVNSAFEGKEKRKRDRLRLDMLEFSRAVYSNSNLSAKQHLAEWLGTGTSAEFEAEYFRNVKDIYEIRLNNLLSEGLIDEKIEKELGNVLDTKNIEQIQQNLYEIGRLKGVQEQVSKEIRELIDHLNQYALANLELMHRSLDRWNKLTKVEKQLFVSSWLNEEEFMYTVNDLADDFTDESIFPKMDFSDVMGPEAELVKIQIPTYIDYKGDLRTLPYREADALKGTFEANFPQSIEQEARGLDGDLFKSKLDDAHAGIKPGSSAKSRRLQEVKREIQEMQVFNVDLMSKEDGLIGYTYLKALATMNIAVLQDLSVRPKPNELKNGWAALKAYSRALNRKPAAVLQIPVLPTSSEQSELDKLVSTIEFQVNNLLFREETGQWYKNQYEEEFKKKHPNATLETPLEQQIQLGLSNNRNPESLIEELKNAVRDFASGKGEWRAQAIGNDQHAKKIAIEFIDGNGDAKSTFIEAESPMFILTGVGGVAIMHETAHLTLMSHLGSIGKKGEFEEMGKILREHLLKLSKENEIYKTVYDYAMNRRGIYEKTLKLRQIADNRTTKGLSSYDLLSLFISLSTVDGVFDPAKGIAQAFERSSFSNRIVALEEFYDELLHGDDPIRDDEELKKAVSNEALTSDFASSNRIPIDYSMIKQMVVSLMPDAKNDVYELLQTFEPKQSEFIWNKDSKKLVYLGEAQAEQNVSRLESTLRDYFNTPKGIDYKDRFLDNALNYISSQKEVVDLYSKSILDEEFFIAALEGLYYLPDNLLNLDKDFISRFIKPLLGKVGSFDLKNGPDLFRMLHEFVSNFENGTFEIPDIKDKSPIGWIKRSAAHSEAKLLSIGLSEFGDDLEDDITPKNDKEARHRNADMADMVNELYKKKGVAAMPEIADLYEGMIRNGLRRFKYTPDYSVLAEDAILQIKYGDRGVAGLVEKFDPSIGVPLAAYINKYLPERAKEVVAKVFTKKSFEKSIDEYSSEGYSIANKLEAAAEYDFEDDLPENQYSVVRRKLGLTETQMNLVRRAVTMNVIFSKALDAKRKWVPSEFLSDLNEQFGKDLYPLLRGQANSIFPQSTKDWLVFAEGMYDWIFEEIDLATWMRHSPNPFYEAVINPETGQQERMTVYEAEMADRPDPEAGNLKWRLVKPSKEEWMSWIKGEGMSVNVPGTRKELLARMLARHMAFDAVMEVIQNPTQPEYDMFTGEPTGRTINVLERINLTHNSDYNLTVLVPLLARMTKRDPRTFFNMKGGPEDGDLMGRMEILLKIIATAEAKAMKAGIDDSTIGNNTPKDPQTEEQLANIYGEVIAETLKELQDKGNILPIMSKDFQMAVESFVRELFENRSKLKDISYTTAEMNKFARMGLIRANERLAEIIQARKKGAKEKRYNKQDFNNDLAQFGKDLNLSIALGTDGKREKLHDDFAQLLIDSFPKNKIRPELTSNQAEALYQKQSRWQKSILSRGGIMGSSAEDFTGLLYWLLADGELGKKQWAWMEENIIRPFQIGQTRHDAARVRIMSEIGALNKIHKQLVSRFGEKIMEMAKGGDLTIEDIVKISVWNKMGYTIPDISEFDLKAALEVGKTISGLSAYVDSMAKTFDKYEFEKPKGKDGAREVWVGVPLRNYIMSTINGNVRDKAMRMFTNNVDAIFTDDNQLRMRAVWGKKYVRNLNNALDRMKTGKMNQLSDPNMSWFNLWLVGSVSSIMWYNSRSAILQLISMFNYIESDGVSSPFNWFRTVGAAMSTGKMTKRGEKFWNELQYLRSSDYMKTRMDNIEMDIEGNILAQQGDFSQLKGKNRSKALVIWALKNGYALTKTGDAVAILVGGTPYFMARMEHYLNQGMKPNDARERAFLDFREKTDSDQQSSRMDRLSTEQTKTLSRFILSFGNTSMQYNRKISKAIMDMASGRGDKRKLIQTVIYYGAIQNAMFAILQQALYNYILLPGGDDDEEKDFGGDTWKLIDSMLSNLMRGFGVAGVMAGVTKDMGKVIYKGFGEETMDRQEAYDYIELIEKAVSISPSVSYKARLLKNMTRNQNQLAKGKKKNGEWDVTSREALDMLANGVDFTTNGIGGMPITRILHKLDNIDAAIKQDYNMMFRMMNSLGWSEYDFAAKEDQIRISRPEEHWYNQFWQALGKDPSLINGEGNPKSFDDMYKSDGMQSFDDFLAKEVKKNEGKK